MPTTSTKPSARPAPDQPDPAVGVNLAVLCGPCSGPAEVRVLESGTRLATLAVRCPTAGGADERVTSVPVTVWDPPAWVETLAGGDEVVVVGRVRRRFYQRPGGVGSRVDVESELIGRARDRRRIDAALRKADEALEALA
jgi:single-stranded DNA-binding protein